MNRRRLLIAAAAFCVVGPGWAAELVRIGGSGSCVGAIELLIREFRKIHSDVEFAPVAAIGSNGALSAVSAGVLDIAVLSRPLSEKDRAAGFQGIEYARTPFVIVVPEKMPVAGITKQELAEILSGKRERWAHGERVRPVLRPPDDTDTDLLKRMSPAIAAALDAAHKRPGMIFAATDRDAADSVENIPGAIGTSTLGLVLSEKRRIKPVALDGISPTLKAFETGSYPYHKRLHVVWGLRKPRPEAGRFIEFVSSPQALAILRQTGHQVPPFRGN